MAAARACRLFYARRYRFLEPLIGMNTGTVRANVLDRLIYRRRHEIQLAGGGLDETVLNPVLDHRQEGGEVAVDVEQDDRLVVVGELLADDDLENLLEGAQPARQRDERVAAVLQLPLA